MIQLAVHKIGDTESEFNFFSREEVQVDETVADLLQSYFLSPFKSEEYYHFFHDAALSLNEVYTYVAAIFDDPANLHEQSVHLAKHLYNQSRHPKIKAGEFYVVYFKEINLKGETVDAVGLFKSENKDTFLKVYPQDDNFEIVSEQGININKLDKGCIIYNTEKESGYVAAVVDNTNKNNEAQYWKDEFLHIIVMNNDYHQTNQFLGIAKQFVTERLKEDFEISKADQIDYLNRSVDYFKTHDTFDKEEFVEEVFHHDNVINSFRRFDEHYRKDHDIDLSDSFDINEQAVKKQARVFKSVLKLDKNFHVYIHGNREMIEQGMDENGRKFYKLYYDNEL